MKKLFGTSGIRGIYGRDVTVALATDVGFALGAKLGKGSKVVIGRDQRTSSPTLEDAIGIGLLSSGIDVISVGIVPTPALAFAAKEFGATAGVMVTASHNPPEYNGIKLWNGDASAYTSEQEAELEKIIAGKTFKKSDEPGTISEEGIRDRYIGFLKGSVNIRHEYRIALDCGNGTACVVSPLLLRTYSSDLESIFDLLDGTFPNRPSEPSEKNISALIRAVKKTNADVGFAHDGDSDRIAVIDDKGVFVPQDKLLALLAFYEIKKGEMIAVPVNTSMLVNEVVEKAGGKVVRTRVGDVAVAQELIRHNGVFGGEPSGCYIFPKVHYCPDGILTSLKVLEIMDNTRKKLSELISEIPEYPLLRETVKCSNEDKEGIVKQLAERAKMLPGIKETTEIDGTRVDFEDAWILVRASGTEPKIRVTVEAKDKQRAEELMEYMLENGA